MVAKSGDGAGKAERSSPALRVNKLRKLLARITERVEALRGEEPNLETEEKLLKLLGHAVKLEGELRALRLPRAGQGKLSGKERQARDEALRQEIADRLAGLARSGTGAVSGEPAQRAADPSA